MASTNYSVGVWAPGNAGKTTAVDCMNSGLPVTIYASPGHTRTLDAIRDNGIVADEAITGTFRPETTSDIVEFLGKTRTIHVCTDAEAHDQILKLLADNKASIRKDHKFIFTSGTLVALQASNLGIPGQFQETTVSFYAGRGKLNKITVKGIKDAFSVPKAGFPMTSLAERAGQRSVEEPRAYAVYTSTLDTCTASTNPICHTPVSLANVSNIDNKTQYTHYKDGMTDTVAIWMEKADNERLGLRLALELTEHNETCLDQLNKMYGGNWKTYPEFAKKTPVHNITPGNPPSVDYRYFKEDPLHVMLTWLVLARIVNHPMPLVASMVTMCAAIQNKTLDECIEKRAKTLGIWNITKNDLFAKFSLFLPLAPEEHPTFAPLGNQNTFLPLLPVETDTKFLRLL